MKARHCYYVTLGAPSAEYLALYKALEMTGCLANDFDDLSETQPSEELPWHMQALLIHALW